MNKHILLVMKWLQDKDSVTQEELEANKESAAYAHSADAYRAAYAAYEAAAAAYYDAYAAYYDAYAVAEHNVNRYFELTGEDKQTYLNNL